MMRGPCDNNVVMQRVLKVHNSHQWRHNSVFSKSINIVYVDIS